jgi:hypothetical protein
MTPETFFVWYCFITGICVVVISAVSGLIIYGYGLWETRNKPKHHPRTTHHLKCWPVSFQAMKRGPKTFEYRKNDRDYQIGDILHQEEWNEITSKYTGDTLDQKITYLLMGGQFGIPEGYCIMSVVPV